MPIACTGRRSGLPSVRRSASTSFAAMSGPPILIPPSRTAPPAAFGRYAPASFPQFDSQIERLNLNWDRAHCLHVLPSTVERQLETRPRPTRLVDLACARRGNPDVAHILAPKEEVSPEQAYRGHVPLRAVGAQTGDAPVQERRHADAPAGLDLEAVQPLKPRNGLHDPARQGRQLSR